MTAGSFALGSPLLRRRTPRIVALQPSISITLEQLGRLDLLVACTKYCLAAVPALRSRQVQVLSDSWSANTEEILAAEPTLVIASVPYRMESLAAILKAGVPVVTLAPHTLADIYQDIRLLGDLVHASSEAEAVCGGMGAALAATQSALSGLRDQTRPLVHCEEWGKPVIHSQPWVAELVSAAGGHFLGTPGAVTDPAAVAAEDPDVLVFAWCGCGDRVPLARMVEQRQWQTLRAVRNGRVYCIPDQFLNTPAANLIDGLRALAGVLHPELFGIPGSTRSLPQDGLEQGTSKIV